MNDYLSRLTTLADRSTEEVSSLLMKIVGDFSRLELRCQILEQITIDLVSSLASAQKAAMTSLNTLCNLNSNPEETDGTRNEDPVVPPHV